VSSETGWTTTLTSRLRRRLASCSSPSMRRLYRICRRWCATLPRCVLAMSVSGSTGTFVIRTPPAQVRCPYCAVLLCTLIACCPAATSSSNRYPRGYPASAPCCVRLDAPRVSNGQVSRSCVCVRAGRLRGGRRMQRFQRGEGRSRQWREPRLPLPDSEVSKQHVTRNSDAEVDARHGALRLCLAAVETHSFAA
jgi:hypothetical protein